LKKNLEEVPGNSITERFGDSALLLCDHASAALPAGVDLGITSQDLQRHIGVDIGALALTRRLARGLGATYVATRYSRLLLDVNRALGQPGCIPAESDGTRIPGNVGLSAAQVASRIATCYTPYHAAIEAVLDALLAGGRAALPVVSVHSFTPVLQGGVRPWEVGVLWDDDCRLALPLIEGLREAGFRVGDNEPYSGATELNHTLGVHARPRGLPRVLLELRQDLLSSAAQIDEIAERLLTVLQSCLQMVGSEKASPA
jgi:predicted N-formylglutamate amidohydrolase